MRGNEMRTPIPKKAKGTSPKAAYTFILTPINLFINN